VLNKYSSYNEIIAFLNEQARKHPGYATVYSAGKSYEKRELAVLRIKTATSRRSVWLDCGIHAVTIYLIYIYIYINLF
jgi:hypothetical protein